MEWIDTSLLTILTGTVAGVVGWFTGKTKRKADNVASFSTAIDAFASTMEKMSTLNKELSEKHLTVFAENAELRQNIITKDNKIEELELQVKELKDKIDCLTRKIDTLTTRVKTNEDKLKSEETGKGKKAGVAPVKS